MQRGFQFLAGSEVVALRHLLDAAVEALDHAVGLRRFRRGQAVLEAQFGAEPVEIVLARRGPFAQAEQAVGVRWSPASGQFAKPAANEDEDEQRGWQTEELQRRVQGEGGA